VGSVAGNRVDGSSVSAPVAAARESSGETQNGPRARPVTLADVAREVGTSASTASRALSGRGYVSSAVRERLLAAADRLGYVANASARTLKQQTSRVVGVVVSDLGNQFYAGVAAGIEETLRAADYQMVLLSDNSESAHELDGARTFMAMRAAGVIMTPVGSEAAELLIGHGIGVVEVDRQVAGMPCDAVVIDNERGAGEATSHLLGLGHRRIGLLVAKTSFTTDAGRVRGYRAAHAAADVPVDENLIVRIPFHAPDAEQRIAALLDVEAPTAIFAANNLLAEQAWRVLRRRGIELPRDISLVGFDDVPWMEMVDPAITAVAQPNIELGRRAARLLLRRVREPDYPPERECLEPLLIVRGSTGPPLERA
jgi:LacI family transcriptional regulator, galactose operon repressor